MLVPQGNPSNPKTFKSFVCSIFSKYGYGTAGFTLGDGLGGSVSVTFTNQGIYGFGGVGVGGGQSFSFRGGLQGGVQTGSPVGLRTFATFNANIGPVGVGADFSGGTNGVDASAGVGTGAGLSAEAGIGVSFTIAEGDPQTSCGTH
jgi:hypothetical protein